MNRVSGRLPVASTRRLSASISSSQRPHSSYSLNVNSNTQLQFDEMLNSHSQLQQQQTIQKNQPIAHLTNCYFDHTVTPSPNLSISATPSSLLVRKQDSWMPTEFVALRNHMPLPPPLPILSYTDHLKSILNNQQHSSSFNSDEASSSILTTYCSSGVSWSPNDTVPISLTTQMIGKPIGIMNNEHGENRVLSHESNLETLNNEKSNLKVVFNINCLTRF